MRGVRYGEAYVVADGPTQAYQLVRNDLNARDLGFDHDRALESVELVAEDHSDPECGVRLYLDFLKRTMV
jgi:hypothetical protein